MQQTVRKTLLVLFLLLVTLDLHHWLVLVYQVLLSLCSRITFQAVMESVHMIRNQELFTFIVRVGLLPAKLNVVSHICLLLKLCKISFQASVIYRCVNFVLLLKLFAVDKMLLENPIRQGKIITYITSTGSSNQRWRMQRKSKRAPRLILPLSWGSHDLTR